MMRSSSHWERETLVSEMMELYKNKGCGESEGEFAVSNARTYG